MFIPEDLSFYFFFNHHLGVGYSCRYLSVMCGCHPLGIIYDCYHLNVSFICYYRMTFIYVKAIQTNEKSPKW